MFHDSEAAAIGYALQHSDETRLLDAARQPGSTTGSAERLAQQDSQFNLLADPLSTPTADQA